MIPPMLSCKVMCEHIAKAKFLKDTRTDQFLTAEEIYNYSPTGELVMIGEWFETAIRRIGEPDWKEVNSSPAT